jgi:hypothetical protein
MKKDKKDCGCGNKSPKIKFDTPAGVAHNVPYDMDQQWESIGKQTSSHNESYFDTNRNGMKDAEIVKPVQPSEALEFQTKLDTLLLNVGNLLKSKNEAYGNTSLNPPNIFSKLDSSEAICARIDDKIMRIKNRGLVSATEDTLTDLIGYLLLLKMSRKK